MTNCLNDARLQAVADGEGTTSENEHVRSCDACGARVADTRAALRDFGRGLSELAVPERLRSRVLAATNPASTLRSGATTLRAAPSVRPRPAWVLAGGAVAAGVIGLLFVVLPSVDSGTRLNAAEILGRSLQTLEGQGIERLEYELSLDIPGVSIERGTYRIEQLIDHGTGRWRFARFSPDGTLLNGVTENPATGIREALIALDGRAFRFRFVVPPGEQVQLWTLQRRYAESMIRLVQASASQVVTQQDDGDLERYVVQLPAPAASLPESTSALFDLVRARVVVDAADFHIVEFSAGGTLMGEPLSIGYRLLERVVAKDASGLDFELPRDDREVIELQSEGTRHVPGDILTLLLHEVVRLKG